MAQSFNFQEAPGHLIRRAHQTSIALFSQELASFDVTALQFAIVHALLDEPGTDQITVAQRVALDAATCGSVILRLQQRGWLRREPSATDRRRKLLWLTDEGRRAGIAMKKHAAKVQQRLMAPLADDEREQLVVLLKKLSGIEK